MKKSAIFATVCIFTMVFAASIGLSTAATTGPEEIILKTEAAKKPAFFPHAVHQQNKGLTCGDCHHSKDNEGKRVDFNEEQEIKLCIQCHNANDMENLKLNSFKLAAHRLCKDCHKAKAKEGIKAPTKCTGCHKKDIQ